MLGDAQAMELNVSGIGKQWNLQCRGYVDECS